MTLLLPPLDLAADHDFTVYTVKCYMLEPSFVGKITVSQDLQRRDSACTQARSSHAQPYVVGGDTVRLSSGTYVSQDFTVLCTRRRERCV